MAQSEIPQTYEISSAKAYLDCILKEDWDCERLLDVDGTVCSRQQEERIW